MSISNFPVVIAVLGTLIGLFLKLRRDARDGGALGRLRADATVLNMLPEDGEAYKKMLQHIGVAVDALVRQRTTLTRDPMGIGVSIFLSVVAAPLLYVGYQESGGLRVLLFTLASPFVLFGIVGFSVSLPRRERDIKGNATKADK